MKFISILLLLLNTTLLFSQDLIFEGANNFNLNNESAIVKEIRCDLLHIKKDIEVIANNVVIYAKDIILEDGASLAYYSDNILVVYEDSANISSPNVVQTKLPIKAHTIIPAISGEINLFKNGKPYFKGPYEQLYKMDLPQARYVIVYNNNTLSESFTIL